MYKLAVSYKALGRHSEALSLFEETLARMKAKLGPDHPSTLANMQGLAASEYLAAGRIRGLPLPGSVGRRADPPDSYTVLMLAALQAWFDAPRRISPPPAGSTLRVRREDRRDRRDHGRDAAKVGSLSPADDPAVIDAAVALARLAVDEGKEHLYRDYFLMELGMAEYRGRPLRGGQRRAVLAAVGGRKVVVHGKVPETSAFYRALILFRQGKADEARAGPWRPARRRRSRPCPATRAEPALRRGQPDDLIYGWPTRRPGH